MFPERFCISLRITITTVSGKFRLPENLEKLARETGYSVGSLARRLGRSSRQLERDFQSELYQTPRNWLNELWIADALKELNKEGTVAGAAINMGYKHWNHFSRDFTNAVGYSPSKALGLLPPRKSTV